MITCQGCQGSLRGRARRVVNKHHESSFSPVIEDSNGTILKVIDSLDAFIKGILVHEVAVCRPCARALIDVYAGADAWVVELEESNGTLHMSRLCACTHTEEEHSKGACFVDTGGKRCDCRKLTLVVATHDDDEDEGDDDYNPDEYYEDDEEHDEEL